MFDARTKKSYWIGKSEAETVHTMTGEHSFETLCKINERRMNPDQLYSLCKKLQTMGFLKGAEVRERRSCKRIRVGIVDPSRYLNARSPLIRFLRCFITYMPFVSAVLVILSSFLVNAQYAMQLIQSFRPQPAHILFALVSLPVVQFTHELGHMATAIYNEVPVPEMGILLRWFVPSFYADISPVFAIRSRSKKVLVLSAGIVTHIIWIELGIFAFNLFPQLSGYMITLVILNLFCILFNTTFYPRLDGYHILTVLLDDPFLHENTLHFVCSREYRRLLRLRGEFNLLVTYGLVAFVSLFCIPALFLSLLVPQLLRLVA